MTQPLKYTTEGIPKNWDGKDWATYKWAMNTVFRKKKLTDIVEGTMTRSMLSSSEREEEFDLNQMKIMRMVGTSVPPDILHQIRDKTTGSEMRKALCDLYEGRANKAVMAHRIRCLRNDLWHTKLSSGEDVNKHLSKMFNLRTELASLQYTVEDIDMVEMLLESLPNQLEFENMKAAIRYNPNYGAFTPDSVRNMIRAADSRQKEFRNGRRGNQKHEGSSGGSKDSSTKNSRSQQDTSEDSKKQKKVRKCHICESTEHLKADCPERAKVQSGGGVAASEQKRKSRGNVTIRRNENEPLRPERDDAEVGVVTGVLDAMMIDARVEAGVSGENQQSPSENEGQEENAVDESQDLVNTNSGWWYFDTAANIHLTGNQSYYVAFTEDTSQSQSVHGVSPTLASRIAGVGTVAIVSEVDGDAGVVYLDDVFYVPGAELGLLSPGLTAEQGFDFDYDRGTMNIRVMDEGRTVIVATPQESTWGFFVTHPSHGAIVGPRDRPLCNLTAAEGVASLTLWHERLAHTCPQYLKTTVDRGARAWHVAAAATAGDL